MSIHELRPLSFWSLPLDLEFLFTGVNKFTGGIDAHDRGKSGRLKVRLHLEWIVEHRRMREIDHPAFKDIGPFRRVVLVENDVGGKHRFIISRSTHFVFVRIRLSLSQPGWA